MNKANITNELIYEYVTTPNSNFRLLVILSFILYALSTVVFLLYCVDKSIQFCKLKFYKKKRKEMPNPLKPLPK